MKKHALLLLVALVAFSCSQDKKQDSVWSGKVQNHPNGLITLLGTGYEKDIILADDGSFTAELVLPYDGYYNAIFGRIPLALYLENGKDLTLQVDVDDFENSLELSGDLAVENNFLLQKRNLANQDLRALYAQEPEEFLHSINTIKKEIATELMNSQIENEAFLESQKKELSYMQASFLNNYENNYTYLNNTGKVVVPADFYRPLALLNLSDTLEFRISDSYKQLVSDYWSREANQLETQEDANATIHYIHLINENFPDGYAKNQLLNDAVGYSLKPDKYLDKVYALYMESQTDSELKQAMEDNYQVLSKITPGKKSPEFDYENYNGDTTSLASLRGKYVYVDVWATWCGPCLREIPFLKEVEEDYREKDVVFVAISIDEAKDYDKWREMIEERELVGVQLYSGGEAWQSDFPQAYNVRGIPRFILIDPEGNIFDADTYRPSDPRLRALFDDIL